MENCANFVGMLSLIEAKQFDALIYYIVIRVVIVLICWLFAIAANIIDFYSGTSTARALGEKLQSHGFRRTITKIGDYVKVLMFSLMFDALGSLLDCYILPFVTMLCTLSVILIEGRSVVENSRRKHSHAADIPEVVKKIVQAATAEQAKGVLKEIAEELQSKTSEEK
jgi:hypothetical protein